MFACEMGSMFGSMLPMWFGGLLIWGALIGIAVWAVLRFTGRSRGDARTILEERFARGEIDSDEFERRRRLLESSR
ncbi:MAG: SHOCT domain-containing protein [Actinomycetota bacterium]